MIRNLLFALWLGLFSSKSLQARPEQIVPVGGADVVLLVDFTRPVELVSGIQAMTSEMILSIAEKCEDPQDAKAVLCFRHLRAAIIRTHSMALQVHGDEGLFSLEASFTPKFLDRFRSVGKMRSFGRHRALAATFGDMWGDDAGSLRDELLVMAPGGRLLLGDLTSVARGLQSLAAQRCYLPTFGKDTGIHYSIRPAGVGLEEYEKLGARLLVLDFKVDEPGRDSFRFELKCDSERQAQLLRPKVISDYVSFFSPMLHKVAVIKEPGLSLEQMKKLLRSRLNNHVMIRDNSLIVEVKGGELDMNPMQFRTYIEEMILFCFEAER